MRRCDKEWTAAEDTPAPRRFFARLPTYLAFAQIAGRQALAQKSDLIGRSIFYVIILVVFSRLWLTTEKSAIMKSFTAVDMVWYIAFTEWIIISIPMVHFDIERDVKGGGLAYQLTRPISYVWMKFAEALGSLLVRLTALGISGFFAAWYMSGSLPRDPSSLAVAIPIGVLSAIVALVFQVIVGLSAFWIEDATPVAWVWQKALFVLGGLILPLELYPSWLKTLAYFTPFPAMLYGPGHLAARATVSTSLLNLALLLFWGAVAVVAAEFAFRRGRHALSVNGG